jgi:hypothetical protein
VHALLIACMHRATHLTQPYYVDGIAHRTDTRLIWLADIQLLAQALTDKEWTALVSLARDKGLCGVTLDGLDRTHELLGTQVPAFASQTLAQANQNEPGSSYLRAGMFKQRWMDFRALKTLEQRLTLTKEALFPDPDYMRAKFDTDTAPLAWLYLRRAVAGAAKQLSAAAPLRQPRGREQ